MIPHSNQSDVTAQSPPPKAGWVSLSPAVALCGGALLILNIAGASVTSSDTSNTTPPPLSSFSLVSFDQPAQSNQDPNPGIKECNITLLSGRIIVGELIRQDSLIVVIGINGIETTFQRDRVEKITILPPVAQRYAQMRKAISDDDVDARLTLIEWLRIRRAYTLAIRELESALMDFPGNPRAKLLYTWLTEYDKLTTSKSSKRSGHTKPSSSPASSPASSPRRGIHRNEVPPLSPEQINLMRVYEIDLQNPPKLRVPDETIHALIQSKPNEFSANAEDRKALYKLPEIDKLRLLFTHKARELYSQVVVLEDPTSMKLFKVDVHSQRGWLLNTCASTRCHGGTSAGPFQLINTRANSNETVYTNFSIIEQYILSNGSSLINYEDPQRSPLLQMAMIEKNSLTPHPQIPRDYPGTGFRPIFRSTRDRKFRDAIDWINAMYQPRPKYELATPTQPEPEPGQTAP